jgi:AraC-like DNA-binding protein
MMRRQPLLDCVLTLLKHAGVTQGTLAHKESGTHLLVRQTITGQDASVYRPLMCAVLQGAKEVGTITRKLTVRAGQSLIVSHAMPIVSRITEATPEHPYVALVFPLDLDVMRTLAPSAPPSSIDGAMDPFSLCLSDTDDTMQDALLRYFHQCESDDARRLLAPITVREVHARLLMGHHAGMLQRLLWHETKASRISSATRQIQSDLAKSLVVAELARHAGMSSSAFFVQFKAITGTSPLQYQKELRLLRARDELRMTGLKVSDIAFAVGYGNPAQFSREYTRKFGRSPREDRVPDPVN